MKTRGYVREKCGIMNEMCGNPTKKSGDVKENSGILVCKCGNHFFTQEKILAVLSRQGFHRM
ncbi:hypothetical protein J2X07_001889 [Fictibacillus barbaricus]|uniref:Uncharacterized protein n=1 Tax=Fictibacillus barbaricus TaxID=182136 RepID=A0ABU1U0B2_9BACL|nr:hypothetical protein [Fictibacillus barbaricus]